MKRKLSALSGRYLAALRKHLKQSPRASLAPARRLGRQAVTIGLETLDVTRMHERALALLEASASKDGFIERANIFFTEAITPIEERHRAARKTRDRLSQLTKELSQRTTDLAASHRSLKQRIAQRRAAVESLKKSASQHKILLEESLALQKHLQHLTHEILSAQEHERKEMSHDLQDEIAQTLYGINVRLLTVEKEATVNTKHLAKEIDATQRLVDKSAISIRRYARECGKRREA